MIEGCCHGSLQSPHPPVGSRPTSTVPPAPLIRAAYGALVDRLAQTWPRQLEGGDLPHLVLAGASWDCWAAYYERVEHELLDDGRFGTIKEWGNKQPGRVARLAGLLHLATHPDPTSREISVATITAACELGEYFEARQVAAHGGGQRAAPVRGLDPGLFGAGPPSFVPRDSADRGQRPKRAMKSRLRECEEGDLNPMAAPTTPGFFRGLRPQVSGDDRLTGL